MTKKFLFLLVCFALILGASSSTALAVSGVPPVVVNPDDGEPCAIYWIVYHHDRTEPAGFLVKGTVSYVYQPSTGAWTLTCKFAIDFDNPIMATIDEACALYEEFLPDETDCKNNLYVHEGFPCTLLGEYFTNDSQTIVSPDGAGVTTCKYAP